jgi:hypothetical protein
VSRREANSKHTDMATEFENIFALLREILKKHRGNMKVSEDTARRFCLTGGQHPKHKTPMPIAWVEIGKAYVSYHLMPIYGCPKLLEGCSAELKARMQGKSCFNFKKSDESLFEELERLTVAGISAFKKAGLMTAND